jgi:anti-sigma factor RsiW
MINDEALMGYIDGQVDAARAREIEAALSTDPELRRRLAELEANDRSVKQAFDALLERPVPDALAERVRASIAAHEGGADKSRPSLTVVTGGAASQPRPRWTASPRWLGWAAAAQFAAIVVLAGVILQPKHEAASYHALGAAPQAAPANLMVAFRPETPERNLREALRSANARIVGGPTAADMYLLNVPSSERDKALATLRARTDVTLVQPVDAPGAP